MNAAELLKSTVGIEHYGIVPKRTRKCFLSPEGNNIRMKDIERKCHTFHWVEGITELTICSFAHLAADFYEDKKKRNKPGWWLIKFRSLALVDGVTSPLPALLLPLPLSRRPLLHRQ